MRIAQAHGPNLLARAFERSKRIVVGDSVSPVAAYRAGRRVITQVRNDPKDLSAQVIEALRGHPANVFLLAGARVADADIHDPPIGIAALSGWVERHFTERVNWRCEL